MKNTRICIKRRDNAGFEIIAACDLPIKETDGMEVQQIVIGKRIGAEKPDYCTWYYNNIGKYNYGHYDIKTIEDAYKDMWNRVSDALGFPKSEPVDEESIYRKVKKQYAKDDIRDFAKSNDFDVPEEDLEDLAETLDSRMDCDLSYWDNIRGLLECRGYEVN